MSRSGYAPWNDDIGADHLSYIMDLCVATLKNEVGDSQNLVLSGIGQQLN